MAELVPAALSDVSALIANVGVLTIFLGVVIVGVLRGLKELRDLNELTPAAEPVTPAQAAKILDGSASLELVAANRDMQLVITQLRGDLNEQRIVLNEQRIALRENTAEIVAMRLAANAILLELRTQQGSGS